MNCGSHHCHGDRNRSGHGQCRSLGLNDGSVFLDLSIPTVKPSHRRHASPISLNSRTARSGRWTVGLWTAAHCGPRSDRRGSASRVPRGRGRVGWHRWTAFARPRARACVLAGPSDARGRPSRDRSRTSQSESRGHGHRGQVCAVALAIRERAERLALRGAGCVLHPARTRRRVQRGDCR